MNLLTVLSITTCLLAVTLGSVLAYLLRTMREMNRESQETQRAQVRLASKMSALIAAKDPMAFQAIETMEAWTAAEPQTEPTSSHSNLTFEEKELLESAKAQVAEGLLSEEEYDRLESYVLRPSESVDEYIR